MNPSLYLSWLRSQGEAQRVMGTGSGHLPRWYCSYLACLSPWAPPLTEKNLKENKWYTER